MAVLTECISVIIRETTIDAKYPGGINGYAEDRPNRTYCSDGVITRVGFMAPNAVAWWVNEVVERSGMTFFDGNEFVDIAIVDQFTGLTGRCSWVEVGRTEDGIPCCWLAGTPRGPVAEPEGGDGKPGAFNLILDARGINPDGTFDIDPRRKRNS